MNPEIVFIVAAYRFHLHRARRIIVTPPSPIGARIVSFGVHAKTCWLHVSFFIVFNRYLLTFVCITRHDNETSRGDTTKRLRRRKDASYFIAVLLSSKNPWSIAIVSRAYISVIFSFDAIYDIMTFRGVAARIYFSRNIRAKFRTVCHWLPHFVPLGARAAYLKSIRTILIT